jgi:hypothetical protein
MKKHLTDISKILGSIVGIFVALWFFGEPFLEDYVNKRIDIRITSPETLEKALKSPYMLDYQINQKNAWRDSELHKENSKIKFSAALVHKTGMNKEALIDSLAGIIKSNPTKSYITSEECIFNSKKYGRARNSILRH